MKIQYLILLVVVALEAGLSVWPEGSFVAAADGETVVVKPATRKGKSPKKIRRTIRVREAAPAAPAVAPAAPAQPAVPLQQAAPVSNEINVKPDISVHVAPNQQQQHQPQQQQAQPVVQIQSQQQPDSGKQIVVPQQQQQQPIVELPDDDDDDDDRQVKAENMQIVRYQQPEQSIVPVEVKGEEEEPHEQEELQIVPISNPATELVDVGSEQMKKMLLKASDLVPQWPFTGNAQSDNQLGLVPVQKGAHLTDPNNTYLNANNIINRRYNPLGWPMSPMNVLAGAAATGYPTAFAQGQMPMIQVNIDEQMRRPWLSAPAATMQIQSPYVQSIPYAAGAPIWQQPAAATSFYSASPVGATLPAAVYPTVAGVGPALVEAPRVSAYYGGIPAAMSQPMMQAQPMMMAPPMVQQQPIMMQPAVMMQPIFAAQPAEMKIKKKKSKKAKKQQVVEIEEPVVEEKTTWVKKEPQFNQYVEETKPAATKVIEVTKQKVEEPEEIEWETVRIPKIKNAPAAASQQ